MSDPVTGAFVVGTGIQIYSQVKSGQDKADAAHAEAANKRLQAKEVETAGEREQGLLAIRGQKASGLASQAVATAGIETSGSSLIAMEDIAHQINSESLALEHATRFRADQLRRGASISDQLGDSAATVGIIDGISTGIGAAGKGYKLLDKNNGSKQKVGEI